MKKTWEDRLRDIRERVANGERLTLYQGTLLLQEYEELLLSFEKLGRENKEWRYRYKYAYDVLDGKREELDERAREINTIYTTLDRLFEIHIYSRESNAARVLLWTVEWRGKKSTGHITVADAYETAISDILKSQEAPT